MRFHFGSIPTSPDFEPNEGWKALREPSPWVAQLQALPIGVAAAVIIGVLWLRLTPLHLDGIGALSPLGILLAMVLNTIFHELIHAVVHPMAGRSSHTTLGFWPATFLFYAHYDHELSRNRFVTILLAPLFIISIVPLLVVALVGLYSPWLAFASVFNALVACVDIWGACFVWFQIPAAATIRNQGWKTYWKEHEATVA